MEKRGWKITAIVAICVAGVLAVLIVLSLRAVVLLSEQSDSGAALAPADVLRLIIDGGCLPAGAFCTPGSANCCRPNSCINNCPPNAPCYWACGPP